jgi:hypothetical protein
MRPNQVDVSDLLEAEIDKSAKKPAYPCPKCGKGTKVAHEPNTRICSNRNCREKIVINS